MPRGPQRARCLRDCHPWRPTPAGSSTRRSRRRSRSRSGCSTSTPSGRCWPCFGFAPGPCVGVAARRPAPPSASPTSSGGGTCWAWCVAVLDVVLLVWAAGGLMDVFAWHTFITLLFAVALVVAPAAPDEPGVPAHLVPLHAPSKQANPRPSPRRAMICAMATNHRRHRRAQRPRSASTSATATGSRSPRSRSIGSPTRPATTSGSTWTWSGPRPGPSAAPIAHGYLTLSLAPAPAAAGHGGQRASRMGVNYGCNKVRFPSPVPVGSKVRLGVKVAVVEDDRRRRPGTLELTFEVEGATQAVLRRRGDLPLLRVTGDFSAGEGRS